MRTVLDKENKISQQVSCSQDWAPLAKGSRVGEYRIVEEISHNGQSITYQAQDCVIGDTVRIQEFFPFRMARRCEDGCTVEPLPNCQTQFKYFRASFMDLYQTLAGEKENPCLIPIIQIFEQNATVYVVSEYLGLQTLEEHLQQQGGKESWCRAKRYLMPLYNALSHLHKRGITHQGLSPQNIFLDQNLNPYLSGFSLSEIRTAQGELDSELFSGYSAPEQYHLESWQGSWTDVYSIAAVTYRVLTGKVPPDAGSMLDASGMKKQEPLTSAIELDADIPENVSEALETAMQPDRTRRYESVDGLLEKLLETVSSNTAVFRVEDTSNHNTVHLPQAEEDKASRVKAGSVYLLITMAATLLVLVVGVPKMYRYFNSTWEALSRDYSLEGEEDQNDTPQEEQTQPEEVSHKVENFVGKKASDVLNNTKYEQWYYFETVEEYNDNFAAGTICDQSLSSSTAISRKTTITLHVSKGPENEPLPELSGKTLEEAIQILSGMGKQWMVVQGNNTSVEPGQIFRTDPPAGTQLSKNSSDTILLYVAVEQPETTQPEEEPEEEEDEGVEVLSQKSSDRKVIKKKSTE